MANICKLRHCVGVGGLICRNYYRMEDNFQQSFSLICYANWQEKSRCTNVAMEDSGMLEESEKSTKQCTFIGDKWGKSCYNE